MKKKMKFKNNAALLLHQLVFFIKAFIHYLKQNVVLFSSLFLLIFLQLFTAAIIWRTENGVFIWQLLGITFLHVAMVCLYMKKIFDREVKTKNKKEEMDGLRNFFVTEINEIKKQQEKICTEIKDTTKKIERIRTRQNLEDTSSGIY